MSLLDQMGQHEQGSDPAEHGPYEVFTRAIDRDSSAQPKVYVCYIIHSWTNCLACHSHPAGVQNLCSI